MDTVELLEELIRIDSMNPFASLQPDPEVPSGWTVEGNETAMTDYLECRLRDAGWAVERQFVHAGSDGRPFQNLLAWRGAGHRSILFYGHQDTVTARPWISRDQALTPVRSTLDIDGLPHEILTGLGAHDMKAGLAVLLTAFTELQPEDFRIKLAFGVDEEFYSLGAHTLGPSGFLDDVQAVVVPEIGDGPNGGWGPSAVTLGRLGRCEFRITVPGTGGHGTAGRDPAFVNAAVDSARIVRRLDAAAAEYRDIFQFAGDMANPQASREVAGSFFVSRVEAGDGSVSIPAEGRVAVSFTHSPEVTVADGLRLMEEVIAGMYRDGELRPVEISGRTLRAQAAIRPRPTPPGPAYCTPAGHPFVSFVREIVDGKAGFRGFNMGHSVADENVFHYYRPGVPILDITPRGGNHHRAGEWVDLESVARVKEIYTAIGRRFGEYRK